MLESKGVSTHLQDEMKFDMLFELFQPHFCNTAPDINNDGSLKNPIEVDSGDSVTVNVLNNDVAKGPRPNRLSVERIANQARDGKCAVAFGKRRVVYTPDRGYTGRDRCVYRACDSRDMCGEANVFFDVIADTSEPTLGPTLFP